MKPIEKGSLFKQFAKTSRSVSMDCQLTYQKPGPFRGRVDDRIEPTDSAVVSKDAQDFQEVVHIYFAILVDVRIASTGAVLTELAQ